MMEELSLHVLDIAMNSLAAGARTVSIRVREDTARDRFTLEIADDGRGMDEATLQKVLHSSRSSSKENRKKSIGLGLALLRQTCEMCDGTFAVQSAPGQGTTVTATMRLSHPDRPPVGDISSSVLALCAANPTVTIRLDYDCDGQHFHFDSHELNPKEVAP